MQPGYLVTMQRCNYLISRGVKAISSPIKAIQAKKMGFTRMGHQACDQIRVNSSKFDFIFNGPPKARVFYLISFLFAVSLSAAPQGTLTSVPFQVTQPYASFLLAGGSGPNTRV